MLQDGAYRRMLDAYYTAEKPLPLDRRVIYAKVRAHTTEEQWAVDSVLSEFFFEVQEGFANKRAEEDIAEYHVMAESARRNGSMGGRKRTEPVPKPVPETASSENLESRTKKEEKSKPMSAGADAQVHPRVLLEIFEQERGGLPGVRQLTDQRLSKCRSRLLNHKADQQAFLAEFRAAVRKASQLLWPEWRPHFDWFLDNDTNYLKVLEGKYDHWGQKGGGKSAAQKQAIEQARERHNLSGPGQTSDSPQSSAGPRGD